MTAAYFSGLVLNSTELNLVLYFLMTGLLSSFRLMSDPVLAVAGLTEVEAEGTSFVADDLAGSALTFAQLVLVEEEESS